MLRNLPAFAVIAFFQAMCWSSDSDALQIGAQETEMINLPRAALTSKVSIESTIQSRRSVRSFSPAPLFLTDMAQLLWAAQWITSGAGLRAAPSAGALYPLEIYLVAGAINDLAPGVYRYIPTTHSLALIKKGDLRSALAGAALGQRSIAQAPASLVITGAYQRTAAKYGKRAGRYVHLEAGHAGQNILLQATAIKMGTVVIGAFDDRTVQKILGLPVDHEPISIIPAGFPLSAFPGG